MTLGGRICGVDEFCVDVVLAATADDGIEDSELVCGLVGKLEDEAVAAAAKLDTENKLETVGKLLIED